MKYRRLSALIGLLLSLVISLHVPAPAQKSGKLASGKVSKSVALKPSNGKAQGAQKTFGIVPMVTSCPQPKTPITSGQTINGALANTDCPFGDGTFFDEYTFTANAGQQLNISMSSSAFDAYLFLLKPSETTASEDTIQDDDGGGGTNSRIPPGSGFITVTETGTYSILANSFNVGGTGAYTLTLNFGTGTNCPPTPTPITNGQTLNGTLDSNDCSLPDTSRFDAYSFSATAGQQVAIAMNAAAPVDAYLFLLGPDGEVVGEDDDGGGGTNARITPGAGTFGTLPQTGTYTIIANSFSPDQFGPYTISLTFSSSNCPSSPINVGQTINGALANTDCRLPLDGSFIDVYTFNGTTGQQIVITQASGFDAFLFLLSPTGSVIATDDDSGGGTGGTDARIPPTGLFTLPSTGSYTILANSAVANLTGAYALTLSSGAASATINLAFATYAASESAGAVSIGVSRTGDTSGTSTVNYATSDPSGLNNCSFITGNASSRCDYATSVGTVRFDPGQTSKNISIPIVDDSFGEGNENFTITLSNATGATLGGLNTATVTINDNEATNGPNPIDGTAFFVRQHYIDFLGREPDPPGSAAWQAVINNCPPGDTTCDRIHVSSAFFRSPEFQDRGYFVYRFYPVSFGRKPDYVEFIPDLARVSGFLSAAELEAAKVAFVNDFMLRPAFANVYDPLNNTQYVDTLLATAGVTSVNRDFWIAALTNGTRTRAQVLRDIAESTEVYNKYFNQAFVVMQYFGYLRRDPDALYLNWIQVLDTTGDFRVMVNGFMNSLEYRFRFGP